MLNLNKDWLGPAKVQNLWVYFIVDPGIKTSARLSHENGGHTTLAKVGDESQNQFGLDHQLPPGECSVCFLYGCERSEWDPRIWEPWKLRGDGWVGTWWIGGRPLILEIVWLGRHALTYWPLALFLEGRCALGLKGHMVSLWECTGMLMDMYPFKPCASELREGIICSNFFSKSFCWWLKRRNHLFQFSCMYRLNNIAIYVENGLF